LSRLGKQEEAREAAKSAVETFRRLPSTSPRRDFDLAVGLNNLGIIESNLGAQAEALRANEEAVLIARGLGDKWSVEARSVLARSLLNLGSVLFSFGAGETALMATREAVEIFRRLTSESPEAFGPDLARSLNKLGEILRSLGRLEEALESISVALNVRRTLAAGRPDVFLAELASSLQNLASTLGQQRTGSEDALSAIQEAVAIRRRIAAQGPQATHLDLVDTLEQLSASLLEAGEQERAIEAVLEAIHILEDANAEQPLELASRLRSLMDRLVAALEDPATTGGPAFRVTLLEQVVRSIARFFHKQPLLFADPMNTALLKYLTTLLRLEKEPDRELLRSIIQAVEKAIVKGSSTPLR
jgi:tetratricopeptide (TPR) repeat protein